MSLLELRHAIALQVSQLNGVVSTVEHGGPVTIDEVKRVGARSPALIVSCLAVSSVEPEGAVISADPLWGVFVLCQDDMRGKRDALALALVESVISEVMFQRWGNAANGAARLITAQNLFTSALDKLGIAAWGVRWNQSVDLVKNAVGLITPFEKFYSTWDIGQQSEDHTELAQ